MSTSGKSKHLCVRSPLAHKAESPRTPCTSDKSQQSSAITLRLRCFPSFLKCALGRSKIYTKRTAIVRHETATLSLRGALRYSSLLLRRNMPGARSKSQRQALTWLKIEGEHPNACRFILRYSTHTRMPVFACGAKELQTSEALQE